MRLDVLVPAALASECGGARTIAVDLPDADARLADVFTAIDGHYPRLGRRLRDEAGQLRRYVNVYVGDEECRRMGGLDTPVTGAEPIQILPSIAGG
jgi:sulfur-carrier protein